jgi:hypothetical protein
MLFTMVRKNDKKIVQHYPVVVAGPLLGMLCLSDVLGLKSSRESRARQELGTGGATLRPTSRPSISTVEITLFKAICAKAKLKMLSLKVFACKHELLLERAHLLIQLHAC